MISRIIQPAEVMLSASVFDIDRGLPPPQAFIYGTHQWRIPESIIIKRLGTRQDQGIMQKSN